MAEEYNQAAAAGMCGGGGGGGGSGNWWDSSRARFDSGSSTSSTSLSATGSYGWLTEAVDINTRSTMDSASSTSSSAVFPDPHKLQGANSATTAAMLLDPNLQIMGLGLSSQAMDWNPPLLNEKAAAESSFRSMLQEGMGTNTNFNQEAGGGAFGTQVQWRTTSEKLFPGISSEDSTEYKQINRGFSLDQPMESHFHLESSSIYSSPSSILQGLIGSDQQQQQQQQQQSSSQYENRPIGYGYNQQQPNYGLPSHDSMMPPWSKNIPQFLRASTPKQPPMAPSPHAQLHFTNTAQFWNAPVASATAISDPGRLSFFPSLQTQVPMPTFEEKPKIKQNALEVRETVKRSGGDQNTTKRPRNEASSTLPPFKVRKEKMGDRITALQQLVSPFGKTDTASVLSEAIEYIKFLHEQISVLSNPYLKSGASLQLHQSGDKSKDPEGPKQDLRSRGLCLVPVSACPVAHEATVDFWTPTFGGSFR